MAKRCITIAILLGNTLEKPPKFAKNVRKFFYFFLNAGPLASRLGDVVSVYAITG